MLTARVSAQAGFAWCQRPGSAPRPAVSVRGKAGGDTRLVWLCVYSFYSC